MTAPMSFTPGPIVPVPSDPQPLVDLISERGAIAIEQLADPLNRSANGVANLVPVASVPSNRSLQSVRKLLDEYLQRPLRRKGTATVYTEAAFLRLVERFQSGLHSVVFADPNPKAPSVTAIFDYHRAGPVETQTDTGWGQHRAHLKLRMSDEWTAWLAAHEQPMSQADFAAFLQDRIGDVILLDQAGDQRISDVVAQLQARLGTPQEIMQLARGIEVRQNVEVRSATSLDDGSVQVAYVETQSAKDGTPLSTPTLFFITIPVFYAGAPYRIAVRIRYRIRGGALTWSLHLYRVDKVFEDAFHGVLETVRKATALEVMLGVPESGA